MRSDKESSSVSQNSPMSITELCNSTSSVTVSDRPTSSGTNSDDYNMDNRDLEVQEAAQALARIRNHPELPPLSLSTSSTSTTTTTSPLMTPTSLSSNPMNFAGSPATTHFMSRLATIPVIKSIGSAYEHTKTSYSIVQYGAEMVESTVKTVAAPLYDKLGGTTLEEWGNKQLDKLGVTDPALNEASGSYSCNSAIDITRLDHELRRRRINEGMDEDRLSSRAKNRTRSASRSTSPHRHTLSFSPYGTSHGAASITTVMAPRSRWQQLVVGASTAAGTTVAVVSEESMKCLKYCLNWLQYAVHHIEQQIAILRQFLINMATSAMRNNATSPESSRELVPTGATSKIHAIKKDVIETLRKVVDVVSRYAGPCLPEQAKQSVKGFILSLPGKWATLQNDRSPTASPMGSPVLGPHRSADHTYHVQESAQKILTLAGESVDMLRSVSSIFSETIERAEGWLERLRSVVPGASSRNNNIMEGTTLPPLRGARRSTRKLPPLESLAKGNQFVAANMSDDDVELDGRDSDDDMEY